MAKTTMFTGSKIAQIRKEYSLTCYGMAKRCRTTSTQVRYWELGIITPTTRKIALMCDEFDKEPNFFFQIPQREATV